MVALNGPGRPPSAWWNKITLEMGDESDTPHPGNNAREFIRSLGTNSHLYTTPEGEHVLKSLRVMVALLKNILDNPSKKKFRKLIVDRVEKKIKHCPRSLELLQMIGFENHRSTDGVHYLTLSDDASLPQLRAIAEELTVALLQLQGNLTQKNTTTTPSDDAILSMPQMKGMLLLSSIESVATTTKLPDYKHLAGPEHTSTHTNSKKATTTPHDNPNGTDASMAKVPHPITDDSLNSSLDQHTKANKQKRHPEDARCRHSPPCVPTIPSVFDGAKWSWSCFHCRFTNRGEGDKNSVRCVMCGEWCRSRLEEAASRLQVSLQELLALSNSLVEAQQIFIDNAGMEDDQQIPLHHFTRKTIMNHRLFDIEMLKVLLLLVRNSPSVANACVLVEIGSSFQTITQLPSSKSRRDTLLAAMVSYLVAIEILSKDPLATTKACAIARKNLAAASSKAALCSEQ